MGRSGLECCAVFFILSCLFAIIIAEEHNGNYHISDPGKTRNFWYVSPRMGRKKRGIPYEDNYKISPALEREQLESLMDTVQEPPWTIVTFNEGKRHTVNYTPRLGRESGEESEADNWLHDSELNRELLMTQRSPPFAPRLGRRMNTYYFDPRLGKRNSPQKQLLQQ